MTVEMYEMIATHRNAILRLCGKAMALEPGTEAYALAWAEIVAQLSPGLVAELLRGAARADEAEAFFAYARKSLGL